MMTDKKPTFSQFVCGAVPVRAAFDLYKPARLWWRLILMLHGKPMNSALASEQEDLIVAAGFRFYAWLYRFLSVVFLLLGPTLLAVYSDENSMVYPSAISGLAGVYLWFVSGLGFAGARAYAKNTKSGAVVLIAFMTMMVAFLSAFIATISVLAAQLGWLATAPNLVATGLLFVFGIGSYFIEIVYLASRENSVERT